MARRKVEELVFGSREEANDAILPENWEAAGAPFMWFPVETVGAYTVQFDIGYGMLRLLKNGKEVGRGRFNVIRGDVVVLDKDYYDVKKYIWR